ncbi:MAG TPA: isochorismatase family cysteine hydrolase [Trueperaceae bacterium]|nr:isochorismatase family cysteine hydrolase [Trueperaceae bacterium]
MNTTTGQLLSRNVPVEPGKTALLLVDVQNFSARPDGGEYADQGLSPEQAYEKHKHFFDAVDHVAIPNIKALQAACRERGVEVLYTVIESLTQDGRDRSLDYKITGFNVPRGSWGAKVLDEVAPQGDEIVLPKSSSSVFISTNIHYLLGNLGVKYLIIVGFVTDQCISSAVRDACDLGYLVTVPVDACATYTAERHEQSLTHIKGYCRQVTTAALVEELKRASPSGGR